MFSVVMGRLFSQGASFTMPRDSGADKFLNLLSDPFHSELQSSSVWASLASSLGITAAVVILFSFFRPYHTVVYAPKLKHADESRAPPPLGKEPFAWIVPLWKTTEKDMIRLAGLDAVVFMRFINMCRDVFVVTSIAACAILMPVNYTQSINSDQVSWVMRLTPQNVWNASQWGTVAMAWIVNTTVLGALWLNCRKVLHLRREYFESPEYQRSLHARTLMLYDLPKRFCDDEGIAKIIDSVAPSSSFARTAIARDVKELPQMVEEHNKVVRKLEKVLAQYLKDPHHLPAARPMCMPSKKDRSYTTYPKGQKVDAIEYLTQRIKTLEYEIKDARTSVDKKATKPFGFASYTDISEAHAIAYMARKKKPQGVTLRLAPRPNDIIWDNMDLSPATRVRKRLVINLWVALLTILWIVPNAMIAVFLVNFANLGSLWPDFQVSLSAQPVFWSIVQGIASPAISSTVYILLPIFFRRLSIRSGDKTKSGRERHVIAKLFNFFVFNNLVVFSVFSGLWTFIVNVLDDARRGTDAWQAIVNQNLGTSLMLALCSVSPYWVTYLLQRQLSTAADLAQLWQLLWGLFMRNLGSPTPREVIELTAPQPFDYASFYNYSLFYTTVALCYATIQPLVLPSVALFFLIDCFLKKYLLMYVCITKNESGGTSWRVLINRVLFGLFISNLVVFLVVFERGWGTFVQVYAITPLPFFVIGFKVYCVKTFDDKIQFFSMRFAARGPEPEIGIAQKENLRSDRLASKFGHPVLYRPLITPMVHAKAQNILASIYRGRLTDGREAGSGDDTSVSGYSDTYALDFMHAGRPGKAEGSGLSGFEIVPEGRLDFEYYKNRPEFAEGHGGLGGEGIYRPGTPDSYFGGSDTTSRPGTPQGGLLHNVQKGGYVPTSGGDCTSPAEGGRYASPVAAGGRRHASYGSPTTDYVPLRNMTLRTHGGMPGGRLTENGSQTNLVQCAAPIAGEPSYSQGGRTNCRAFGGLGGVPQGYGNLPTAEPEHDEDPLSYNYFRGRTGHRKDDSGSHVAD